jgi:drug/metabolite transporter (DMT)-like permease
MKRIIPYLSVVTAMLIWAGSGIAVKEALVVFTPLTLIVLRFTLAVILMLSIGLIFRQNEIMGLQCIEKKDIPLFLLGGLFQPFLYFIFETYTYQSFASPTIAEALLSTQPVMAPIFAFVLLRERVTRNNIIGILISTIGMLMLLLMGNAESSIGNGISGIGMGVILAILTVSMSVSYSVILRRIPSRYSPLSIVFYVQSISLVLFYIVWLITDNSQPCIGLLSLPLEGRLVGSCQLSSLFAVGYLAVFASVTAFVLFCYTVRKIGVTRANIFNNVRPVFTAILMWMIFGEILPIWKLIGIAVIIIGLFVSERKEKRQKVE